MCLGIPMKVVEISDFTARCEAKGIEREVSLFMLQHEQVQVGDHVVVHVGYAIQKVSAEEAADSEADTDRSRWTYRDLAPRGWIP